MEEFFVEKSANENGEHLVHTESCSSIPTRDELRWIGARSTNAAPVKEAGDWFSNAVPCPDCMAG